MLHHFSFNWQRSFMINSGSSSMFAVVTVNAVNTSVSLGHKCFYYARASKGQLSRGSVFEPETRAKS